MTVEILIWVLVVAIVGLLLIGGVLELDYQLQQWRLRRIRRIEAELDRTQAELRATILKLASELGADAHEARKALIRESFMASQMEQEPFHGGSR